MAKICAVFSGPPPVWFLMTYICLILRCLSRVNNAAGEANSKHSDHDGDLRGGCVCAFNAFLERFLHKGG